MSETQTPQKRTRDEDSAGADFDGSKRQKPFEEEDDEPSRDLSAMFTTFQNEISPAASQPPAADGAEDFKLSVMRYLFEASDDELGIPNTSSPPPPNEMNSELPAWNSELDGMWELEDEAANYYAVMQSQILNGVGNGM